MEHHKVNSTVANLADGDAAVRFLHAQEEIRRARSRRRWITAGIVLASLFLLMVGCSALVVGAAGSATAPAPSVPVSAPAASSPVGAPRDTATAPAATVAPEADIVPMGAYPAGTYRLGYDIAPGDYVTDGPTGPVRLATWSRLSDTSGASAPIAFGIVEGHTVITVSASDAAVKFTGSATWRAV
jgi:hypothetical protein